MSKIKKSELLDIVREQGSAITNLLQRVTLLEKPQLKQLDQSAFDHPYATDRFKYVALNADGQAVFFESKPVISNCLDIWVVHTGSVMPMLKGYDASNWQNSLIERDTAKELLEVDLSSELTGSELCKAMLARGDYHVMCAVSDISESDAILSCNSAVITSGEIRGAVTNSFDGLHEHAVPINNQGEPLTQAEAGL